MSQAIEMALVQVNASIPREILLAIFEPFKRGQSLDHCVYEDVIQKRVLRECNLFSGKMTSIPLSQAYVEAAETSPYHSYPFQYLYAIYRIPPEAREHRPISKVISVEFPTNYFGIGGGPFGSGVPSGCGGQNMQSLACDLLQGAAGGIQGTPRPLPQLLAGDLVRLTPSASVPLNGFNWMLTCRLEYDSEMTNLTHSAIRPFVDLVEAATKAYIYNHAILKIDKFYTDGGLELGRVREVIDSYSDQEQRYRELFDNFRGAAVILDEPALRKIIYWGV